MMPQALKQQSFDETQEQQNTINENEINTVRFKNLNNKEFTNNSKNILNYRENQDLLMLY